MIVPRQGMQFHDQDHLPAVMHSPVSKMISGSETGNGFGAPSNVHKAGVVDSLPLNMAYRHVSHQKPVFEDRLAACPLFHRFQFCG